MFGYHLRDTNIGKICVADLEKAVLDFLYLTPEANTTEFFEEMRFDKEGLRMLNHDKLKQYLAVFNQKMLQLKVKELLKYAAN